MSFYFPHLLFGMILIVIPFLIHFYQRYRRKKVYFSAIFLFKEEIKHASRTIKLKNNLLIFMRALLILLIAMLLAKPMTSKEFFFWERKKDNSKITLILLDNSKSMGYFSRSKTYFQETVSQLREFIKKLPETVQDTTRAQKISSRKNSSNKSQLLLNNPVLLAELSSSMTIPIKVVRDKDKLIKRLRFVSLNQPKISFSKRIKALLQEMKNQKLKIKEIFVFSDFQKSDWKGVQFSESIPLVLIKIGEDHPSNLGILKMKTSSDIQFSRVGTDLTVTIKNFGAQKEKNYLTLILDNQLKKRKEIILKPNEEKQLTITKIKILDDKLAFGEIYFMYDDRYAYDNKQSFSLYFKKKVNILLLAHKEYPLIAYSIKKSILAQTDSKFDIHFSDKLEEEIENYDFIITNRVSYLSFKEIQTIKSFLRRGIPILIFLNHRDKVHRIRKFFKICGLSKEIEVIQRKQFNRKTYMKIKDQFDSNPSSKYFNSKVFFQKSTYYDIRYKSDHYFPLLKVGSKDIMIYSSVPERNLFLFTADFKPSLKIRKSQSGSNFVLKQWFPVIINWIFNEGLKKRLQRQVDITPDNIESYTQESDLTAYSIDELNDLFTNKALKVIKDINKWTQGTPISSSKTVIQTNTSLESLFFVIILNVLFLELLFSYPVGMTPYFKKFIFKTTGKTKS